MKAWSVTIDQQTQGGQQRYGPFEVDDELLPLAVIEAISQAKLSGAITGSYQITATPTRALGQR